MSSEYNCVVILGIISYFRNITAGYSGHPFAAPQYVLHLAAEFRMGLVRFFFFPQTAPLQ